VRSGISKRMFNIVEEDTATPETGGGTVLDHRLSLSPYELVMGHMVRHSHVHLTSLGQTSMPHLAFKLSHTWMNVSSR